MSAPTDHNESGLPARGHNTQHVAVADVGGTTTKLAVATGTGLDDVRTVATPRGIHAADEVIDLIADHATRARAADSSIELLGVVVPGVVDDDAGIGVWSENLGWRDVPFRNRLEQVTGMRVAFGHDVATAGLAEVELGAARGAKNAAVIVIGTGIAAAIVADGRLLRSHGYAGELGHSIVQFDGPPCVCGSTGCLEAVASAAAIARAYNEAAGAEVAGAAEVLHLMHTGDRHAQAIWQRAIDALALGIRQLQAIVPSEVVVIGGGLSNAGNALFGPLERALDDTLSMQPRPRLVRAALGDSAGLAGAAILARRLP